MNSAQTVQMRRLVDRVTLAIGSTVGWHDLSVLMNALGTVLGEMAAADADPREALAVAMRAADIVIYREFGEGAESIGSPGIRRSTRLGGLGIPANDAAAKREPRGD